MDRNYLQFHSPQRHLPLHKFSPKWPTFALSAMHSIQRILYGLPINLQNCKEFRFGFASAILKKDERPHVVALRLQDRRLGSG